MLWRAIMLPLSFTLAGCLGEPQEPAEEAFSEAPVEEAYSSDASENAPIPATSPPQPSHNYQANEGLIYSYIADVSEDERKAGKAAGDVLSFAYLGKQNGKHALAQVNAAGQILYRAYCADPCVIIAYQDGRQIAFTENSVIGAAFADAIAGRMQVAQATSSWERNNAQTPPGVAPSAPEPLRGQKSPNPNESKSSADNPDEPQPAEAGAETPQLPTI